MEHGAYKVLWVKARLLNQGLFFQFSITLNGYNQGASHITKDQVSNERILQESL